MKYELTGNSNGPALLCVPGLLGGIEDFASMKEAWQQHFHVIALDPNAERRESAGVKGLTADDLREVNLDINKTADVMRDILEANGKKKAFLVGVSLGGKMVFDFIIRYPEYFAGGVVTDVGPTPVTNTDLFHYVNNAVLGTNLDLPWPELKKDLAQRIPERALRSLIQTQIYYPNKVPPADWRPGMMNFQQMLDDQSANDQLSGMRKVDSIIAKNGARLIVLKAATASAISKDALSEIKQFQSVVIDPIPDSNHFIHITHRQLIQDKVLGLIQVNKEPPQNSIFS